MNQSCAQQRRIAIAIANLSVNVAEILKDFAKDKEKTNPVEPYKEYDYKVPY